MSIDVANADLLLSTTRSVRKRLDFDRPVEREVLLECLQLAVQAPTASNIQTWRWMVVTDPDLRSKLADYYRAAALPRRQRAMLDFAVKLTATPWEVEEEDREALRRAGFSARDIWDIAAVAGFFNMSNRVASATDMRPNSVYHAQAR